MSFADFENRALHHFLSPGPVSTTSLGLEASPRWGCWPAVGEAGGVQWRQSPRGRHWSTNVCPVPAWTRLSLWPLPLGTATRRSWRAHVPGLPSRGVLRTRLPAPVPAPPRCQCLDRGERVASACPACLLGAWEQDTRPHVARAHRVGVWPAGGSRCQAPSCCPRGPTLPHREHQEGPKDETGSQGPGQGRGHWEVPQVQPQRAHPGPRVITQEGPEGVCMRDSGAAHKRLTFRKGTVTRCDCHSKRGHGRYRGEGRCPELLGGRSCGRRGASG